MADDVQDNFNKAVAELFKSNQEVVGAPPVVEQEVVPVVEEEGIGLSSLLGGAKEKAGDILQRLGKTFDPGIPEEAFPATIKKTEAPLRMEIPPKKPTEEQRVFNRLSIKKLNPAAIAGLMGSIDIESGGTFAFDRQEDLYKHGDQKGDGYGLFQFTDYKNEEGELVGHLTEYKKYLEDNNLVDSSESQIDYVLDNIYLGIGEDIGGDNRKKLQEVFKSGSPEEVTVMFTKIFERPQKGSEHMDRRMQSATQRFESISGNRRGGMISRNPYPHNPRPI